MDTRQSWAWLSEALRGGLEKILFMQQEPVAGYVERLRRARPEARPAEIIAVLEKQYLATVTGTGAAVGGVAAVPALGTVLALALSGGESVAFLQVTGLFALALAEVHGIRPEEELERHRTSVLAVVLGDHRTMMMEKITGQTAEHWTALLPEMIPKSSITTVNKTVGNWLMTKYGRTRGIEAVGKVAPFGVGVAVGAGGNRVIGRMVIDTSRRVFGPPPATFPDGDAMTVEAFDVQGDQLGCSGGCHRDLGTPAREAPAPGAEDQS